MYQVYKIDESQIPNAARRTIATAFKLMVGIYFLFNVYLLVRFASGWKIILIGAAVCIPAYGLAMLLGYALLKQSYRRYRIVLDDEGVEFSMPRNDKKIKWQNLKKIIKPDGIVELNDGSISKVIRKLTGDGSIQLIPEIEHFKKLLEEIDKHSY